MTPDIALDNTLRWLEGGGLPDKDTPFRFHWVDYNSCAIGSLKYQLGITSIHEVRRAIYFTKRAFLSIFMNADIKHPIEIGRALRAFLETGALPDLPPRYHEFDPESGAPIFAEDAVELVPTSAAQPTALPVEASPLPTAMEVLTAIAAQPTVVSDDYSEARLDDLVCAEDSR